MFWSGAKYFFVDAILVGVCIFAIVYWIFDDDVSLDGAAVILLVYAFANVIRFNAYRKEIKDLKKHIDIYEPPERKK